MRSFLRHYFGGLYDRIDEHHVFLIGGGLAFSIFVCVVPFILIVFFVLGNILDAGSLKGQIDFFIATAIPYEGSADYVKQILFSRAGDLIEHRNIYGVLGGLGLLFAASGLFSSMRTVLNTVYRVKITKSEVVGKLRDFGMVLLVLCFFTLSVMVFPVFEVFQEVADRLPFWQNLGMGWGLEVLNWVISPGIRFGLFWVLYAFVTYGRLSRRVVWVSAFWAVLLGEVAEFAFGYYISHSATIRRIYGAYVLFIVAAFWIYYSSIVFILGAEIGQLYRERLEKWPGKA